MPDDDVFTRTVNVGDTGVNILMKKTEDESATIQWRKDGSTQISDRTELNFAFSNAISSADEGIYEIHYFLQRTQARGSLYRLIVRGKLFSS